MNDSRDKCRTLFLKHENRQQESTSQTRFQSAAPRHAKSVPMSQMPITVAAV
jgi:hypothetical protein